MIFNSYLLLCIVSQCDMQKKNELRGIGRTGKGDV